LEPGDAGILHHVCKRTRDLHLVESFSKEL
jgi:hypothetical protein